MTGWLILIGFVLFEIWLWRGNSRDRRKLRELGKLPDELKKTSTFGSFFFCLFAALLTLGIIAVISTIGRTLPQVLDACVIGGIFFVPAFICWYIGFRHDRPKLNKLYGGKANK